MKRVKFGDVHFMGEHDHTLCGQMAFDEDLLGKAVPVMQPTEERVTCPACARLYCHVKNAPWNEVDDSVLEHECAHLYD